MLPNIPTAFYCSMNLLVFALLICDTAACFASRLTGSLAFTASAVFSAAAEIFCFECFNMFHSYLLLNKFILFTKL